MPRDRLGDLEHRVMLAILRLGGEAYSVPIVLELEKRTGQTVSQSAVFIALRGLEGKGFLSSRLDDHAVPETGRVRRYFELTPAGLAKLSEARRSLQSLWKGVTSELDEVR